MIRNTFLFLLAACLLFSCGSSKEYVKSPVDDIIKELDQEKDFTVILYDMDSEGSWSPTYKHRYKIITNKQVNDSTAEPQSKLTEWKEVDENFFDVHVNDMGMEIASKSDGVVKKQTAPPGYSNYVGNDKYGQWKTDNSGNSFWAFYGRYAFMSNMIGLFAGPVYRRGYMDYRTNYYGTRPYYGTATSRYGTFSSASKKANPSFHKKVANNSSFKSRVNSSVSRSTSAKSTRSGSRYSTGSSRSRSSSGFGK